MFLEWPVWHNIIWHNDNSDNEKQLIQIDNIYLPPCRSRSCSGSNDLRFLQELVKGVDGAKDDLQVIYNIYDQK